MLKLAGRGGVVSCPDASCIGNGNAMYPVSKGQLGRRIVVKEQKRKTVVKKKTIDHDTCKETRIWGSVFPYRDDSLDLT